MQSHGKDNLRLLNSDVLALKLFTHFFLLSIMVTLDNFIVACYVPRVGPSAALEIILKMSQQGGECCVSILHVRTARVEH